MRKPDFFIVGSPKCGTTSMCNSLRKHPEIFIPPQKELNYFCRSAKQRGKLEVYLDYFAAAGTAKRIGEGTVWYLHSEIATQAIKNFTPEARIIIMLRDPVEMVYSLHSQLLYTRDEDIPDFADALAAEPDRRTGRRIPASARFPQGLLYREMGKYFRHVSRYLNTFGSERVKILLFDDFVANTCEVVAETCQFLDVNPNRLLEFPVANPQRKVRFERLRRFFDEPPGWLLETYRTLIPESIRQHLTPRLRRANISYARRPPLNPRVRDQLAMEFADDAKLLSRLIGRDLGNWCRRATPSGQ